MTSQNESATLPAAPGAAPKQPDTVHSTSHPGEEITMAELAEICELTADEWRQFAESAEAELRAVMYALSETNYMDPPDGGAPTIAEQVRRMVKDARRYLYLRGTCGFTIAEDLFGITTGKNVIAQLDEAIDENIEAHAKWKK